MKRRTIALIAGVPAALIVAGLLSRTDAGQPIPHGAKAPLPRVVVSPGHDGYYQGGYFGGHASTYPESVLRGQAALLRARGEQALNTAEALRSVEAAVDQALDNKAKALEVRQQRALMARAHRAELERIKLARQAEARAARLQEQAETEAAMTPEETAAKRERLAAGKLELARRLKERGHADAAQQWMREIVEKFPGTAAAREISGSSSIVLVGQ